MGLFCVETEEDSYPSLKVISEAGKCSKIESISEKKGFFKEFILIFTV